MGISQDSSFYLVTCPPINTIPVFTHVTAYLLRLIPQALTPYNSQPDFDNPTRPPVFWWRGVSAMTSRTSDVLLWRHALVRSYSLLNWSSIQWRLIWKTSQMLYLWWIHCRPVTWP